jgi:hypothetical protein
MSIIIVQSHAHLGDNIINFIFFYQIKNFIEENNIVIHYYCLPQYHKNLLDFNCSENIKILNYENKGYVLWQGTTPLSHFIEDQLCNMFNIFLKKYNFPILVNSFEYKDPELFTRFESLEDKYKNIDILIINSTPLSGQYQQYNKQEWDNFIIRLSQKYIVATSQKVDDEKVISLQEFSVKNIASIALKTKIIIAINTGPSIPFYNTDILDNIDVIYLFGSDRHKFKTRKIREHSNINELSFLLS